jgi:hypothetical protein
LKLLPIILTLIFYYTSISSSIIYGFNRFNDNINFNGLANIKLDTKFGKFLINQNYRGNATLFNGNSNLNDNQSLRFDYQYNLKFLDILYKQNFDYVGDNYTDFSASSLINSKQLIGVGYKLDNQNFLNIYGGMDNHLQLNQNSVGSSYGLESGINFNLSEWLFNSRVELFRTQRTFDRNENITIVNSKLINVFSESKFELSADYNSLQNNYLRQIADNSFNVENREQDQYSFTLRFDYNITDAIKNQTSINYGIFNRSNSFRDFNENNNKSSVIEDRENDSYMISNNVSYDDTNFQLSMNIDYFNESFQNNLTNKGNITQDVFNQLLEREKQLDFMNEFTRLNFNFGYFIKKNMRINSYGMIEINRMNTPSDKENKDRDLFTTRFGVNFNNQVSDYLNFNCLVEGRARHLVYLKSEFSADNNWERNLRLKPQIIYSLSNFEMRPNFEIYVSYRNFDFPDITTNIRSDAQRLIRIQDSISYKLSERYEIKTNYFYLYKETGRLDWQEFAQSIDEIKNETFINTLIYLKKEKLVYGVGLRYYSLTNESQISLISNANDIILESISPETQIFWQVSDATRLEISGWYEFQFNKNSFQTIPNLYLQTIIDI